MTEQKVVRHRPRTNGYMGYANCGVRADKFNIIVTPRLKTADCPKCLELQKHFAERGQESLKQMLSKPSFGPLRKPIDNSWMRKNAR